jgi:Domain of unknown function (DUF4126)
MDAPTLSLLQTLAIASVLAWASGIRLYATILIVGLAAFAQWITLPGDLGVLANPIVLGAAAILFVMEFLADKIPGVDSLWDGLHTFIRIPAGALLAAGATTGLTGDTLNALTVAAGLIGGTITAGTHFTKAGGRALINTSPEPVSNLATSVAEDVAVVGGLWLAFAYPWAFLGLLVLFVLLVVWLLPKLWRLLKRVVRRALEWIGVLQQHSLPVR